MLQRPTPHVITDGRLVPALLASTAIPGNFPAVSLDGRQLYDGGVVARRG
jgi:NTE family protein